MRDNLKDKIYGNISYNTNEIISKANTIAIMSCGIRNHLFYLMKMIVC